MSPRTTPDQRVRVFVSSTLHELETERRSAKESINKLRFIPLLFELVPAPILQADLPGLP